MTFINQYYISDINSGNIYKAHNEPGSESTEVSRIDISPEPHNHLPDCRIEFSRILVHYGFCLVTRIIVKLIITFERQNKIVVDYSPKYKINIHVSYKYT